MRDNPTPTALCWEGLAGHQTEPRPGARPGNLGQEFRMWDAGKGTEHLVDTDLAWHLGGRVKDSWEVLHGVHGGLDLLQGLDRG